MIKVKHTELEKVANTIKTDSEEYSVEIESMLNNIEQLKNVWQGGDSEQLCENLNSYVTYMKNIPVAMTNMYDAINIVNNGFKDIDESFGKQMNPEADNYEE